ncbi:hypothetical protein Riv7116_1851 [Rivularia sp. PCC 7116]|uniref:hypothetical protein n=1 Tax=Rivularia sp. PCC 7116 TaxID=373994 RepID=UPI00029F1060|nr:hypothetical protein [Rivularia sp. PCC 7116]AFY54392.1 hypothetical protein Riv7116_1851 [Rivularia sp. PCC 7116]
MAELGPRVTVAVGKDSTGKAIYSYMLKKHADFFKFPGVQNKIVTRKNKKGKPVAIRGAIGQGHIKVPTGKKSKKGAKRYYQMPMPAGMTIAKIGEFLKTASKNKPDSFVTEDGVTYPINTK